MTFCEVFKVRCLSNVIDERQLVPAVGKSQERKSKQYSTIRCISAGATSCTTDRQNLPCLAVTQSKEIKATYASVHAVEWGWGDLQG